MEWGFLIACLIHIELYAVVSCLSLYGLTCGFVYKRSGESLLRCVVVVELT